MVKSITLNVAKKLLPLLAVALMFIVSCSKSGSVKPITQTAASPVVGKWEDGKEEQKVYDSTNTVVADTVFDTGNNYRYEQYTSSGNYYSVATEFGLDTQQVYKYKITSKNISLMDINDANYTESNIVQLAGNNLEIEYTFATSGASSVQVQMFNLDPTKSYTVNFFKYYTKLN